MILLLCLFLFICSFVLFSVSRHDFVLLRQNIAIRQIFDKAFIIALFAFLVARVIYLLDNKLYDFFLDPLRFTHIILYYGFSIFGFLIAVALGVILFFRKRKNVMRILDIYILSFFPLVIFEGITYFLEENPMIVVSIVFILVTTVLFFLFVAIHNNLKIRDGVVTFLSLSFLSLSYLIYSMLNRGEVALYSVVQVIAAVTIAVCIYMLVLIKINFFKEK